ncbi:hypothetical protein OAO18_05000 [Francisellaceae bacterium]|nr:hypothetical protein [Francisellaceae bacterium]
MAKFVLNQNDDDQPKQSPKKQSKYDKSISGKNIDTVATEKSIDQVRYEEDKILDLKAAETTTEINTESDLTQTHKAGSTTTIKQLSPIVDKTYQGDSVSEKTSQHDIKMKADNMAETFVGKIHEIHSYASYQSQTPQNETYTTTDNITFNTTTYNVVGDKTKAKGKKIGGVATTGILKQGSLIVKADKYKVKTSSAINFYPADGIPNMPKRLEREIKENQWEYDPIQWDKEGILQVQDVVYEPVSKQFYFFNDPQCHNQLNEAVDLIRARERLSKSNQIESRQDYMAECRELLSETNAFTSGSQLAELIHFGSNYAGYMNQAELSGDLVKYAVPASASVFDDEKQTLDAKQLTDTLTGQLSDIKVENNLIKITEISYEQFRKCIGLHSQDSLLDEQKYNSSAEARVFRYAAGISNELGFINRSFYLPLTQVNHMDVNLAQGKATMAGYFPSEAGNLVVGSEDDQEGQGIFLAELNMELEGFAGASFLLSDEISFKGQAEETSNENVTYPYIETQSKAAKLQSVPYGNKITGDLAWLNVNRKDLAKPRELDKFFSIAKAGGAAELPQDLPYSFKIEYVDSQFYIAMNTAWLFEKITNKDQKPKYKGDVMQFVVTSETMLNFIEFAYYQLVRVNYEYSKIMDEETYHALNDIVSLSIYSGIPITQLAKNGLTQVQQWKAENESKEKPEQLTDLAFGVIHSSNTLLPYLPPRAAGNILYQLVCTNIDDQAVTELGRKAARYVFNWVQSVQEYDESLKYAVSDFGKQARSAAEGAAQIWQDTISAYAASRAVTPEHKEGQNIKDDFNNNVQGKSNSNNIKDNGFVAHLTNSSISESNVGLSEGYPSCNAKLIDLKYEGNGYSQSGAYMEIQASLNADLQVVDKSQQYTEASFTTDKQGEFKINVEEEIKDIFANLEINNCKKMPGMILSTGIKSEIFSTSIELELIEPAPRMLVFSGSVKNKYLEKDKNKMHFSGNLTLMLIINLHKNGNQDKLNAMTSESLVNNLQFAAKSLASSNPIITGIRLLGSSAGAF